MGVSIYHAILWLHQSPVWIPLIFIIKASGSLIGHIISCCIFKRSNQVTISSFSLLGLACSILLIPPSSRYLYLLVVILIQGFCTGLLKNSGWQHCFILSSFYLPIHSSIHHSIHPSIFSPTTQVSRTSAASTIPARHPSLRPPLPAFPLDAYSP